MRVLVAEDDPGLRSVLERGLRENGYVVDAVDDGERALSFLRSYEYAVAVLDWRMPGLSGVEVIGEARRLGLTAPVLLLTARDATGDRVAGLDAGADDYLVKPFDFGELLARIRALQRRPSAVLPDQIVCGGVIFDPSTREVTADGSSVQLTATELGIVELLARRSPSVVDRRTIAVQVWAEESDAVGSNTIDVRVARLRSKLGGVGTRIETVRGVGYRMVPS